MFEYSGRPTVTTSDVARNYPGCLAICIFEYLGIVMTSDVARYYPGFLAICTFEYSGPVRTSDVARNYPSSWLFVLIE